MGKSTISLLIILIAILLLKPLISYITQAIRKYFLSRKEQRARNEKLIDYRKRLLLSFPEKLKDDVRAVINILPLNGYDIKFVDGKIHKVQNLISPSTIIIQLDAESLTIPYRVYFDEPPIEEENKLSGTQKAILNCIFLRHHNGYLRQRRLGNLLNRDEYWVTPYTIQLLGEYVFEILVDIDKHVNETTINNYKKFIKENPKYWQLIVSRMISYWDVYYRRRFPKLKKYLGRHIADRIVKVSR